MFQFSKTISNEVSSFDANMQKVSQPVELLAKNIRRRGWNIDFEATLSITHARMGLLKFPSFLLPEGCLLFSTFLWNRFYEKTIFKGRHTKQAGLFSSRTCCYQYCNLVVKRASFSDVCSHVCFHCFCSVVAITFKRQMKVISACCSCPIFYSSEPPLFSLPHVCLPSKWVNKNHKENLQIMQDSIT